MSEESTPEPQRAPEEPAGDDAPTDALEAGSALSRGFLAHFARATVPGTELTIRAPSARQASDNYKDAASEELDDREFTVVLVQRQLDQELALEDVRAWADEQLLDAADAYLSLDTDEENTADEEDGSQELVEGDAEGDTEPEVEAESLTFAAFRDAICEQGARRAKRLSELFAVISSLTTGALSPPVAAAMKGIDMAAYKAAISPLAGVDLSKITGLFASSALAGIDLKALAGTSAMGDALKKMMADTQAVQKFPASALPPLNMRTRVPALEMGTRSLVPIRFTPEVRPEVGLLRGVGESLEKMHDDQVRLAEDQLAVLTEQGQVIRAQGEAVAALVDDVRGQKWSRRTMLWLTVVIAVTGLALAFLAGGIIRPFGAGPEPTFAPVVTTSPVAPPPSPVTAP